MPGPTRLAAVIVAVVLLSPAITLGEPVSTVVDTTLKTGSKQIRQFAFDGDDTTFFASKQNPGVSDHFTLFFERPVSVQSVAVVTGKSDPAKTDKLDAGVLEVSADGKTFTEAARFVGGEARGSAWPSDPGPTDQGDVCAGSSPGRPRVHHHIRCAGRDLQVSGRDRR